MEDRSPSQIVISALELYTRLSPETHLALRRIEQVAGKHAVERILTEFGHHILDRQFDAALDAAAAQIGETHVRGLESDEQFLSAASTAVAQTSGRR